MGDGVETGTRRGHCGMEVPPGRGVVTASSGGEPRLQVSPEWAGVQGGMPEMACWAKTNKKSLVQGVRDDKRASVPGRLESPQAIVHAAALKAEAAAQAAEGSAECLMRT